MERKEWIIQKEEVFGSWQIRHFTNKCYGHPVWL